MALPKEPRQKMINLMYLVLTALLALNVSAEILNAFKTVDNSLHKTNSTINTSTANVMESFKLKLAAPETRQKAQLWFPKATQAQQLSSEMYDYIENLRMTILKAADFDPSRKGDSTYKEDNQDIATRILIKEGKGKLLRDKMTQYRAAMLGLVDPKVKDEFERTMQVDVSMPRVLNKSNKTWEDGYFHMVPTVAALTILRKFQNDVRTTENRIVTHLHEQVGKVEIIFDAFEAIVGQNSKYLMPGQELEITAGLGAFSKSKLPTVNIAGSPVQLNEKGMAVWKNKVASSVGNHKVPVTVTFFDQDNKQQTRTFDVEYTIGQSNTAIALPEMNVLYIGYPNKVTVSGGGVGAEKINISVSGGGARPVKTANGQWTVNVSQQTDNCIITATADGKTIGAATYRVRQMPSPIAAVGGMKSGAYVNAGTLQAQAGVAAYIENFPLPLKWTVTSFLVVGTDENGDLIKERCNGNSFSPRAKQIMKGLRSGDIITFEEIQCQGPDGSSKRLPALLYNIN